MKSIKLTDKEIEFLRVQYQMELEEALKYVEEIKVFLGKLGAKPVEKEEPETKKRGRKPKVAKAEAVSQAPKKRGRKPRKDKGAKRGRKKKVETKEAAAKVEKAPKPVVKKAPKPAKKKKVVRKKRIRGGIVLKNLSKPIKIIEPQTAVASQENTEK
ncbi:MAG: hypothetical protein FJY10_07790 [Bacteroidetes bacterium]|nr:hypothetical protein [Bacteroidota bacterium]